MVSFFFCSSYFAVRDGNGGSYEKNRSHEYGAPSVAKSLFGDIKQNVTKFIKCNEIQRNEIQMP